MKGLYLMNILSVLLRELITNASDTVKVRRVATVALEVFSEIEDEVVDGTGSWIHIVTPDYLQDMLAAHYFAFVLYQ